MQMLKGNKPKSKIEFSKKLVAWAMVLTSVCLLVSYTLAFFDHDACSEITVSVTTACIAIAVAYEAKSYGEKNSRNKYGLEQHWKQAMDQVQNAEPETFENNCNDALG